MISGGIPDGTRLSSRMPALSLREMSLVFGKPFYLKVVDMPVWPLYNAPNENRAPIGDEGARRVVPRVTGEPSEAPDTVSG